jgi:hypothetical protein
MGRYLIARWDNALAKLDRHPVALPRPQNTDGEDLMLTVDQFPRACRSAAHTHRGGLLLADLPRRSRKHRDPLSLLDREQVAAGPREGQSLSFADEANAVILEFKTKHYADWIDQPLPALGGKTPRVAVGTETAGRSSKPGRPGSPRVSASLSPVCAGSSGLRRSTPGERWRAPRATVCPVGASVFRPPPSMYQYRRERVSAPHLVFRDYTANEPNRSRPLA